MISNSIGTNSEEMTILKIPEVNEGSAIQNDANGQKLMKKKNGRKKSSKDTTSTAPTPAEMTNNDFSLEEVEDPSVCEACLDGTVYEDNEILFCDKCNVPVHQNCQGIASIPEGAWFCDACFAGADPKILQCELCSNVGGIYKMTEKPGKWAHILCSFWIPEIYETDTPQHKTSPNVPPTHLNLTFVDKKRYRLKCGLCSNKGACIQCCAGRCAVAAHPWCVVKNPKGFTRRIIKNDEGFMVWEIFCKTHAKAVTEPYKPRSKAKTSVAINIGDSSEPAEADGSYWPEEEIQSSSSKPKNKKMDKTTNKQWLLHANTAVDNKMLFNSKISKSSTNNTANDDEINQQIEKKEESSQFPILTFLEWPGQTEGEGMDLDHFWNVISTYFAEDHSLPWLNDMVLPLRKLFSITYDSSNSNGDDSLQAFMTLPQLGKDISIGAWQELVEIAEEKLSALGSDKERFSIFDPVKRNHFLSRVDACIQQLQDGNKSDDDEPANESILSALPSSENIQAQYPINESDRLEGITAAVNNLSTSSAAPVLNQQRNAFVLSELSYLRQPIIFSNDVESAKIADPQDVDASQNIRVAFDGDNRVGCILSLNDLPADGSLASNQFLLNEEWPSSHIIPYNSKSTGAPSQLELDSTGLELQSMKEIAPQEDIIVGEEKILPQDYDDELCRVIRSSQIAYSTLSTLISSRIEYILEAENLSELTVRKQQEKAEWSQLESVYVKQQIWKHVSGGISRGFKDQLPDFNKSEEENLPASWTIQVNGRPAPPKDDDDEPEIQEDAVCMACFDGSSTDWNKILFCDGCNATMHQICYGVNEIPEGDFYCDRCKYVRILYENEDPCIGHPSNFLASSIDREKFDIIPAKVKTIVMCCLCPIYHGAIKPTTDGRWVHLCCALWAGKHSTIEDLSEMSPINISQVPITAGMSSSKPCQFCGIVGGYMERCSHQKSSVDDATRCSSSFHPICAWFEGAFVSADITDPTFQGSDKGGLYPSGLTFSFLCERHSLETRGSASVKDEQHALRSKYRISEDDLEQIPGTNKRRRNKKKRKPKESSGRITAVGNVVKELNRDIYDDKICAICFNPMENNIFQSSKSDLNADSNKDMNSNSSSSSNGSSNISSSAFPFPKLQCCECSLVVHGSCYIGRIPADAATWRCNSCTEKSDESPSIKCNLCPRTGGFFLPTTDSTWAHIFCARSAPGNVIILPESHNNLIDIRSIPKEFKKQKCIVCNRKYGACLKCNFLGCNNHYHALCGTRSGKAFVRVRMGESVSYCHEHIPDGIERFRPGYWVDGQELQLLRYSLDRARLIIDILCRRDRCKKMLCKVETELFTLRFPRILDKAKGRRSKNNAGEVDLSDFSINSSESEEESEVENDETTAAVSTSLFSPDAAPIPPSGRRGRAKQRPSIEEPNALDIYADIPEKLDLISINTPNGDLEISSTWINMRKREVRLPKKIGVSFSGIDLYRSDILNEGKNLKAFLKSCKEGIIKNVNETRENTRIFEDQNSENSFVSSMINQLNKHLQSESHQFTRQMAPFMKVSFESKKWKKAGKKGYVTIVEPYEEDEKMDSSRRSAASVARSRIGNNLALENEDEVVENLYGDELKGTGKKRGRKSSTLDEEGDGPEKKRKLDSHLNADLSTLSNKDTESMVQSPSSATPKKKRGRPKMRPETRVEEKETVDTMQSDIFTADLTTPEPLEIVGPEMGKLEEEIKSQKKKRKEVKDVDKRGSDDRYSFRKSHSSQVEQPQDPLLDQNSAIPETEPVPEVPIIELAPPEPFAFKSREGLREALKENPFFSRFVSEEVLKSSEEGFLDTYGKLEIEKHYDSNSLKDWIEYPNDSLFILERQIQDILRELEAYRLDDSSNNKAKKQIFRPKRTKSPLNSPAKVIDSTQVISSPSGEASSHRGARARKGRGLGDDLGLPRIDNEESGRELVEEFMEVPYVTIPDYDVHVRRPITVETLKRNLKNHQYLTMASFSRDVYSMLNNARAVTKKNSKTWPDSITFASIFEKLKASAIAEPRVRSNQEIVQRKLEEEEGEVVAVDGDGSEVHQKIICSECNLTFLVEKWPTNFFESANDFVKAVHNSASLPVASPLPSSHSKKGKSSSKKSKSKPVGNGEGESSESMEAKVVDQVALFKWICKDCIQLKNDKHSLQTLQNRSISPPEKHLASSSSLSISCSNAFALPSVGEVQPNSEHELLNRSVLVWWQDDGCCYHGIVNAYDPSSQRHRVLYDDGEWEFIDLASEPVVYPLEYVVESGKEPTSSNTRYNDSSPSEAPPQKRSKRL